MKLAMLAGILLVVIPMSFWTDRNLDFWISQWKGEIVDVHFFFSFLITLTGPFMFVGNIVGEICRLVL